MCFDPLVKEYLNFTTKLRKLYPPPSGEMLPCNMPGFRGPQIKHDDSSVVPTNPTNATTLTSDFVLQASISDIASDLNDPSIKPLLLSIFGNNTPAVNPSLGIVPIQFGNFSPTLLADDKFHQPQILHGQPLYLAASTATSFNWALLGLNSGHFISWLTV